MRWLLRVDCYFFFQAEDGIRDIGVTGVQTCALPISAGNPPSARRARRISRRARPRRINPPRASSRSEERRVGKECRSWWSPYDKKKNQVEHNTPALVYNICLATALL